MENSIRQNGENEKLTYKLITPKDIKKTRSPKLNIKNASTNKKYKESSFVPKKYSLIIGDSTKSIGGRMSKSVNNRKNAGPDDPRKGVVKKFEFRKDYSKKRVIKKDVVNRKFIRKNVKKKISPKKRRESNAFNRIKVVGIVSAKLNALIQRLQNNASSGHKKAKQFGDKVVIAPRIKAALEKFNKRKEEKPEIIHFSSQKRKISNGNGYNKYETEKNEEEGDEEYEEEEENEENDKKYSRNILKTASNKKRFREKDKDIKITKDVINNKKKGDDSKYKENECDDEDKYTYEYEENGKKKRKRRKKMKKQRQNSKGNYSQESTGEYEESNCEEDKDFEGGISIEISGKQSFNENKKNYNIERKKRTIVEFSEEKSEKMTQNKKKNNAKEKYNNEGNKDEEGIINLKRNSILHKSGKLTTLIKNENKNGKKEDEKEEEKENNQEINNMNKKASIKSQNPINMIKYNNNCMKIENLNNGGNIYASQNKEIKTENENGNVLTISKRFVKNIEFDSFSHKNYAVTNYKSKLNGKKNIKELRKYIPSKQIDFILFKIYDYKTDEELYNEKIFKGKVSSKNRDYINLNSNNKSKNNNDNAENDDYNFMKYKFNSCLKKNKLNNKGGDVNSINYKTVFLSKNKKNFKRRYNSVILENKNDDIDDNSNKNNNGMTINNTINDDKNEIPKNNNISSIKKYRNNCAKDKQINIKNNCNKKENDIEDNYSTIQNKSLIKNFKNNRNRNFDKDEISNDFKNGISLKNYNRKNEENADCESEICDVDEFSNKSFQNLAIVRNYSINNAQITFNSNNFKNNISSKIFNNDNKTIDDNSNNFKNSTTVNKYDYSDNQSTFKNQTSIKQYNNKISNSNTIQGSFKNTGTVKKYKNKNYNSDDNQKNFPNAASIKKYTNKNNNYDDNPDILKNPISNKKYHNTNDKCDDNMSSFKNPTSFKNYNNINNICENNPNNFKNVSSFKKYNNQNDICIENPNNFKYPTSFQKYSKKKDNFDDNINFKNPNSFKKYNKINDETGNSLFNTRKNNNNDDNEIGNSDGVMEVKKYKNNEVDDLSINLKNNLKLYKNNNDDNNLSKFNNNHIEYKNLSEIEGDSKDIKNGMELYNNNYEIDSRNIKNNMKQYKNKNDLDDNPTFFKDTMSQYKNNIEIVNKENPRNIQNSVQPLKKNTNNDNINKKEKSYKNGNSMQRYGNNSIEIKEEGERKYFINQTIKNYNSINNDETLRNLNTISMQNYNNTIYAHRLSNIETLKAGLINESITINNECNKRRRYQSIILKDNNKDFLDLNENGFLKNNKNKNNSDIKKRIEKETNSLYLISLKKSNDEKGNSKKKRYKENFDNTLGEKEDNPKLEKKYKYDDIYRKFVTKTLDEDEDSKSSNSSSHSIDNNNLRKKNLYFNENSNKQLYYEFLYKESNKTLNDTYNNNNNIYNGDCNIRDNKNNVLTHITNNKIKRKEKRVKTVDARNINKGKNVLNKYYNEDNIDIYGVDKYLKRKEKRGCTIEGGIFGGKHDYTLLEDNFKGRGRLRYKKAKIRKFKSHRDDYEPRTYIRKKKDYLYLYWLPNDKIKQTLIIENKNKKSKHYKKNSCNKSKYNISQNCSIQNSDNEEQNNNKNYKTSYVPAYRNRIKKIKNNGLKNRTIVHNYIKNKEQKNEVITLNSQSYKKRRINIIINRKNKSNILKLNNTQYKINRKLVFTGPSKKQNSSAKNLQQKIANNIQPKDKKLNNKLKFKEMEPVDAIKSKFKKRLIKINDKLIDAIHYYNGPIDISCISSQHYVEAVKELINKKVIKNGFKFIKKENDCFKFSNGLDSFLVEIVKIRNNILYYLVLKNQ